jgi:hypothetical protein
MTKYQPATPHSDSIKRPPCSKCGAPTVLCRIEPDSPGHEQHMFECSVCQHEQSEVVKIK